MPHPSLGRLRSTLVAALLYVVAGDTAAQDAPAPPPPTAVPAATASPPDPREDPSFWQSTDIDVEAGLANVYESNIGHDPEPTPSFGLVPALEARARRPLGGGRLSVEYGLAQHAYSNTDEWDRTSHELVAGFEADVLDDLETLTEAEVSLGGSSEDRELANQYQLRQSLELSLSQAKGPGSADALRFRLGAYGTLRYKTVPGDPDDSAFKPNVGLVFQQRWPEGLRLELEARLETNREQKERGNYRRATYALELRLPVSPSLGEVEVDVRRRRKSYLARLAEDEDGDDTDQLREDTQWTLGLEWRHELLHHLSLTLGAEHEWRASNDADKHYAASVVLVGVDYRF